MLTASEKPVERASISPESRAAMAFPPASKGMYFTFVGSAPAALKAIAGTRWSMLPGTEPPPMATLSGFFLYAATRSLKFLYELPAGTTSAA